jgi:hypothetical protein
MVQFSGEHGEVYRFPLLRFKPSDLPPHPFVIREGGDPEAGERGKQGENPGKTQSTGASGSGFPLSRNDGKRIASISQYIKKNHSKRFSPTLSPFIPILFKRLLGIENLLQFLPIRRRATDRDLLREKRSLFSPATGQPALFSLSASGRAT